MAEIKIIVRDVGTEIEFEIEADEELPDGDPSPAQQIALEMLERAMERVTPAGVKPENPEAN